ncbi:MAG: hypothetical protein KF916_06345 [Microbacteriaceae bacterium]|nr:hypothetical protein [Microbacteriaceae bacterium]
MENQGQLGPIPNEAQAKLLKEAVLLFCDGELLEDSHIAILEEFNVSFDDLLHVKQSQQVKVKHKHIEKIFEEASLLRRRRDASAHTSEGYIDEEADD